MAESTSIARHVLNVQCNPLLFAISRVLDFGRRAPSCLLCEGRDERPRVSSKSFSGCLITPGVPTVSMTARVKFKVQGIRGLRQKTLLNCGQ